MNSHHDLKSERMKKNNDPPKNRMFATGNVNKKEKKQKIFLWRATLICTSRDFVLIEDRKSFFTMIGYILIVITII